MRRLVVPVLASLTATVVAGCHGGGSTPTWEADVAPMMAEHCQGCHQAGAVSFPLQTYDQVKSYGVTISHELETGIMPPWPPESGDTCPKFIGDRHLASADVELMKSWLAGGMPRGEPTGDPPPVAPTFGTLENIAAEFGPDEDYVPSTTGDDYHCFLVDSPISADAFITAYKVDVGAGVHHVQLWEIDDDDGADAIAAVDAASPEPGYACSDEPQTSGSRYLTVWGPSDPVRRHPAGTGVRIKANKRLVIQVHYHNAVGPSRPRIGLQLADHVDEEASMFWVSKATFTLPPRVESTVIHAEKTLQDPVKLWGVRAHMHTLGSEAHIERVGPSGSSCLLSIPKWNPSWQLMYFYEKPIELAAGDKLSFDCTYDTRSKSTPVSEGPTGDDEMCFSYYYVTGLPPQ